MGVLTFYEERTTVRVDSYYVNNSSGKTTEHREGRDTLNFEVSGLDPHWRILRSVLYVTVGGWAFGTHKEYCTVDETEVTNGAEGQTRDWEIRVNVHSNRTVNIPVAFMCAVLTTAEGTHSANANFLNARLEITYDEGSPILPPDEDDLTVMVPEKRVLLFNKFATSYEQGGIVLQPTSCTVSEEANGSYELEFDHPFDPEGRWQTIEEESIIKAPIPPTVIPAVTMPAAKIWRVKTSVEETSLYGRLPTWTASKDPIDKVQANPSAYAWSQARSYTIGALVVYSNVIWRCTRANSERAPSYVNYEYWRYVTPVTGEPHGEYNPGKIIDVLAGGETISFVADYNATWIKVRSRLGKVGYVHRNDCEETSDIEIVTTEHRFLYTQLFRVYEVECDEATKSIRVSARHISYDLQANVLFDCQVTEADPATAIAMIQGSMVNDDLLHDEVRTIACDITDVKITADWSFKNPVQALLDPDDGVAAQTEAKVLRDNRDIFILQNRYHRGGPRLAYGVNVRGVTWKRSVEEAITRIIPRAKDDEEYLYLHELYIDSENIGDFALIRTEVLDSQYSVGQKIEKADGSTITLSRDAVLERMREEAEDRFYKDNCDAPSVELDVDFVLLGDTEEFRQYRHLQRLNMFDRVQVDTGTTSVSAQVTGYEWDCLAGRYLRITVGKVYSQQRARIPGYRVASGAITFAKLAPALAKKIGGGS